MHGACYQGPEAFSLSFMLLDVCVEVGLRMQFYQSDVACVETMNTKGWKKL
jgi:hypothetical protein